MQIHRPVAALTVGLALVCGGVLTGCANASESATGTPADDVAITTGNIPGSAAHDHLPYLGERVTSVPGAGRAGGNAVGVP